MCYSSFLLSPWTDAASPASGGFVSELEDPGQPFAWLYRTSDVLAGLGIVVAAYVLWRLVAGRRWAATGVALFALTGASSVLDAVTSMQCDPSTSAQCAQNEHTTLGLVSQLLALHTDSGLLGFVGSAAGAAVVGVAVAGRWPLWGRLQIALGIAMASCGLADIVLLLLSSSIGTTERTRVLFTSGWFLIVGLFLAARAHGYTRGPRPSAGLDDLGEIKSSGSMTRRSKISGYGTVYYDRHRADGKFLRGDWPGRGNRAGHGQPGRRS